MMLIPNNVNQTMDFQGTFFRPMRRAKGAGRFTSSAANFGIGHGSRAGRGVSSSGSRSRTGLSGQSAAAGRGSAPRHSGPDYSVTTTSQSSPFRGKTFRHSVGYRPVTHPVAAVQTTGAHTCESTTTKTTALEFAVATPAVTSVHGRVCGGQRSLT
jgi:hypothetical protein